MKQLPLIVPIVTSIAAFVLVLLALLAGTRPGFMESYDIVTVCLTLVQAHLQAI